MSRILDKVLMVLTEHLFIIELISLVQYHQSRPISGVEGIQDVRSHLHLCRFKIYSKFTIFNRVTLSKMLKITQNSIFSIGVTLSKMLKNDPKSTLFDRGTLSGNVRCYHQLPEKSQQHPLKHEGGMFRLVNTVKRIFCFILSTKSQLSKHEFYNQNRSKSYNIYPIATNSFLESLLIPLQEMVPLFSLIV